MAALADHVGVGHDRDVRSWVLELDGTLCRGPDRSSGRLS